ncbi:hypothetical protein [Candidatus Microthrix parvicella]|uniref:Transposase DDE domain-containing protein n=1 Tax=Candidatus Neomicrothrix parvicella RN1 TaxID=1229780 RepID=R4YX59_9ACTN|nr:hypothetical protein [Candidatus Microthrix parvicella]CCM62909.1 hypothetical protein BN381_150022 [Candidatus Microthrix parvicella RN1]
MNTSCHSSDRIEVVFDHPNLVSDSGLLLMSTLARCLGLPGLVRYWVHTKAPNPAAKVMTLVMGMIAGATRNGTVPAFPFGFGLSYSEFELTDVTISVDQGALIFSCVTQRYTPG